MLSPVYNWVANAARIISYLDYLENLKQLGEFIKDHLLFLRPKDVNICAGKKYNLNVTLPNGNEGKVTIGDGEWAIAESALNREGIELPNKLTLKGTEPLACAKTTDRMIRQVYNLLPTQKIQKINKKIVDSYTDASELASADCLLAGGPIPNPWFSWLMRERKFRWEYKWDPIYRIHPQQALEVKIDQKKHPGSSLAWIEDKEGGDLLIPEKKEEYDIDYGFLIKCRNPLNQKKWIYSLSGTTGIATDELGRIVDHNQRYYSILKKFGEKLKREGGEEGQALIIVRRYRTIPNVPDIQLHDVFVLPDF